MKNMISKNKGIVIYMTVWILCVAGYWIFTSGQDGLSYAILVMGLVLPATTIAVSIFIGNSDEKVSYELTCSIIFSLMYMLSDYFTFSLDNNITYSKINVPEFSMIPIGFTISFVGMAIGHIILRIRMKYKK